VAQRNTSRKSSTNRHKTAKTPSRSAKTAPRSPAKSKKGQGPRVSRSLPKEETDEAAAGEREVTIDRRRGEEAVGVAAATASPAPKLERRKKVNRRRQIDPTTCERDYTDEEVEFMNAIDDYKHKSGRMFPTCSEVLEVVRGLGYMKLSPGQSFAAMDRDVATIESPVVTLPMSSVTEFQPLAD
jgi:hypothetical protein